MPEQKAPARKTNQPSTRHLVVVDARFAGLLAEDFGIPAAMILDALSGEPQHRAIAITEWANRTDDPAHALICWAKKHHKGHHRRCGRGRGLPTERPDRHHAQPSPNSPARGRGFDTSSGAAVDSLRGVRVSADTLDQIAARMEA